MRLDALPQGVPIQAIRAGFGSVLVRVGSGHPDRTEHPQEMDRARAREGIDPGLCADGSKPALGPNRGVDGLLGPRQRTALDLLQAGSGILEPRQELEQLVPTRKSLGDQPTRGQRQADHVVRSNLALPEQDHAGAIREKRSDDLLDLQPHAGPELARGEDAALHQDLPEAVGWPVGIASLSELVGADHARPKQALSQAVHLLVGGREDDLAPIEVDRFGVVPGLEEQKTRLGRGVDHLEKVGQGERANVRDHDQLAVPGQGSGRIPPGALQEDRPGTGGQHSDRFVLADAQPGALRRREGLAPRESRQRRTS